MAVGCLRRMDFNGFRGEISCKHGGCAGLVWAVGSLPSPRAEEEWDKSELSLAGIALSSWSLGAPGSG